MIRLSKKEKVPFMILTEKKDQRNRETKTTLSKKEEEQPPSKEEDQKTEIQNIKIREIDKTKHGQINENPQKEAQTPPVSASHSPAKPEPPVYAVNGRRNHTKRGRKQKRKGV